MIAALALAAGAPTLAQMRDHKRVLIIAAPDDHNYRRMQQWDAMYDALHDRELDKRDVVTVEIMGNVVRGSSDEGAMLRRRWRLPVRKFEVLLISKDGHEVLRSSEPVNGSRLIASIDAMPMRRAGLR